MGKVLERIIMNRLSPLIEDSIPHFQHGFVSGRGTASQLLRTANYICDSLEEREHVAMLSTDLSKVFGSIHHKGLIYKLDQLHLPANIIKTIENYLQDRTIIGKLQNDLGTPHNLIRGVPQGSILGPILWNLYTADNPSPGVRGHMYSQYADDLCILNSSQNPRTAVRRAEWAAHDLLDYYNTWGLKCNTSKTECVLFSHARNRPTSMKIGTDTIPLKTQVKYLGATLDQRLTGKKLVQDTINKVIIATRSLAPIIGRYSKASIETKLLVIKSCIQPILDYGVLQFLPRICKSQLKRIEVQYKKVLKRAEELPRSTPDYILWDLLDEDPYHHRLLDLQHHMIQTLSARSIPDLDPQSAHIYNKHLQHNILAPTRRLKDTAPPLPPKARRLRPSQRPPALSRARYI